MKIYVLLLFAWFSLALGCRNKIQNSDSLTKVNAGQNNINEDVINLDTLEGGKIGIWNYLGWAKALKEDTEWNAYPYFFQPVGKSTGVLELKEMVLPGGLQLGNLTFNMLPLIKGDFCCTEVENTVIIYSIVQHNGCAVKGFYQPVNNSNFNSTYSIISYDSSTTDLHLNFDILFKVRASDRLKHSDLPEFIHFKNGKVRTRSIR